MSESDYDRVWEIMDDIAVCMVTTHAGGKMRSRPMHAIPDRPAGCIYFVTDTRGAKDDEIAAAPDVCLAFADIGDNTYLSVTGTAEMIRDPAKAEDLWAPRRRCGGRAARTIRASACCGWFPSRPNTGTRAVIRSRWRSSSSRRGFRGASPIWARTGK
jgi:general stress protein 26